jgi:hypothetical protein
VSTVVVILVLLALAGLIASIWKPWRPPSGSAAVRLGQGNPTLISPAEVPAQPGFAIQAPSNPGFTVMYVSPGRQVTASKNGAHFRPAAANGFEFVGVTENLTAVCKLTGRQAADCKCDRHRGRN